jgi:outer membrane protein assembly factor BamD (BamD/ComL family)
MPEIELLERCKLVLLSLLFAFILVSESIAQVHPNHEIQQLITSGMDNLINQDFHKARVSFSTLQKKYPQNPLGKIFLAATELAIAYDYQTPADESKIISWLNDAIALSERLLESDKNNAWYNYYRALAEGYKANVYLSRDNWFSGTSTSLTAKQYFERCIAIDSSFYDAYVSLGIFKYWSGEKTEFLNWLPFKKDERNDAVKMLYLAANKKTYHMHMAVHNLVWICLKNKDAYHAKEALDPLLKKYPNSRFLKWDLARIYEETDRVKAIAVYWEIYNSFDKNFVKNRCNEISLKYILAKNYFELGDAKTAHTLLSEIPAENQLTSFEAEKLGSRLDRIKTLRAEVQKKL